ncbi:MAG: serine/threonine-protein kinase, partial [Planctomycetota bacterium]
MSTPESSLQSLFEALIDAAPDERESTIRSSGLPETDQRALLRMLQADDRLGDSKEPSLRQHPWPGDAVGDYRLIAPIGNGGMGNVWQAHSLSTPGLVVAVKFANWTRDEHTESAERLAQEGRILAAMKHPGIVSVFASGVTATGRPYLVLDELPGPTLDAFLNQRRHSAWDLAQIMLRLCDAVVAAHQAGVIHRDIKPANVIIIGGLSPVLVDFGAALVLPHGVIDSTHVTQGASPMTPAFASPEQSRGEQATPATDVFALGRIIKLAVQSLSDPTSATTRLLDAVATRACSDDPVDRYPHAQALADDLSERLAGLKQRLPSSTGRWKRSTALAVASALAIGLGMGAVAHAWFWSNGQIIEAGEEHFGFETIEDALDEIAETVDDQNDDATLRLVAETPWHELDGSA